MLVRILKFWTFPNILRQTPGCSGEWQGVKFIVDEPGEADYIVIHGHVAEPCTVRCPRGRVWLLLGEAPTEVARRWHAIPNFIDRAYTTDATQSTKKHVLSHPFLPWWVNRDYDSLSASAPMDKRYPLSWVTSNASALAGHKYRLQFLEKIRGMPELRLFGAGFDPLEDKWSGLADYRYSIAFENFSNSHYWTEKVMDCFLAWTMPIYYGCTQLHQFFPRESYVQLDPEIADPVGFIRDVVNSDWRERNLEAIGEARRRVLNDHNLFNVLVAEIGKDHARRGNDGAVKHPRQLLDHTRFYRINKLPAWMQPAARGLRNLTRPRRVEETRCVGAAK
jgi:hypothetical protein